MSYHPERYQVGRRIVDGVLVGIMGGGVAIFAIEHKEGIAGDLLYRCCGKPHLKGVKIDKELNAASRGKEVLLSTPDSTVKVVVIPTDEEFMIASDTLEIVNQAK